MSSQAGRLRIVGDMALPEDLDAGCAHIRDGGQRRFQVHARAVVAHEAVEGDAVAEGAVATLRASVILRLVRYTVGWCPSGM